MGGRWISVGPLSPNGFRRSGRPAIASRISNAFTLQNHSTTVCFLSADGWGRRREGRVGEEARGRLWQARAACSGECDKHSKGRTHHPDEACQTSQSVVWISWAMLLCLMTQKAVCGLVALAGLTVLLVFNSNRIAEAKPRYAVQAHHQPSSRHHALEEYGKVGPATQNLDDGLGRNRRATSQRKRQRQGEGGGLCASGSGTARLYIVESIYCAGSPRINKGRWTGVVVEQENDLSSFCPCRPFRCYRKHSSCSRPTSACGAATRAARS